MPQFIMQFIMMLWWIYYVCDQVSFFAVLESAITLHCKPTIHDILYRKLLHLQLSWKDQHYLTKMSYFPFPAGKRPTVYDKCFKSVIVIYSLHNYVLQV